MRTIIHLDLDAFFAQVEQVRLQLDPKTPVVCQQWNGVIAVNYPAREFGISRFHTIPECKAKCPQLVCAHVPTLSKNDPVPRYRTENKYDQHKISLCTYRAASRKIMDLVKSICPNYEIASVDEVYMDVTNMVDASVIQKLHMTEAEYSNLEQSDPVDPRFEVDWSDTLLVGENPTLTNNLADFKIKEACIISSKIRKLIFDTLGYTCSSGIAHNKTLAKIVSSMNKPNKQTAIRQAAVLDFMASIKFSKIRGLGGKLGDTIESKLKVEKASDIWQYSLQELQAVLGIQAGTWLYDICRGECNEPVSPKEAKNSIQSFKNFRKKLTLISDIHEWALCFCHELFDRAQEEFEISKRWPKNISISIRCEQNKVSKSCPFPRRDLIKTAQDIYNVTEPLLAKEARIPLSGLGIALNNLEKPPASVAGYFKQIVNPTQSLVEESKPLSRINIDDYQRDIEDIIESEETYLCEICCKHIELSLRNEHNDFHFAETFNQHEPESGIPLLEEVDEMGQPTYYKCLECFKILPRTERQEHQDRHFAIEISRQLENPTASVTKRKREDQDKKIKEPGKKPQQKSIADFFTKKQPL